MTDRERPPPNWLQRSINAQSNTLRIVNLAILAALASVTLTHISYHQGYATMPILFIAIACGCYIGSILDSESSSEWLLASMVTAMFGTALSYIYTFSFVTFGIGVLIIAIPTLSYLLKLAQLRDGMMTVVFILLIPLMGFTSFTLPGRSVGEGADGQYTYHAQSAPLEFWFRDYAGYHNLSSGTLVLAGLPEGWSATGHFELPNQAELTSENFEKIFSVAETHEGTVKGLRIPVPPSLNITAENDPAVTLQEYLQSEYGPVRMTFEVRETSSRSWYSQ